MKVKNRPRDLQGYRLKEVKKAMGEDYRPFNGLENLITELKRYKESLQKNPKNYCADYGRMAELLVEIGNDVLEVSEDFCRDNCGGCFLCQPRT